MSDSELRVRVTPRCRQESIAFTEDGLIAKIVEPPFENLANESLIRLLSKTLGIPKSRMRILRGAKSRNKIVRFDAIEQKELNEILLEKLK